MRYWGYLGIACLLSACHPPAPPIAKPDHVKKTLEAKQAKPTPYAIVIDPKTQTLTLLKKDKVEKVYTISTSKHGLGQTLNSFKTPIGLHRIVEKIGEDVPPYGIFHRRQYTGMVFKKPPLSEHRKDYIVTRVLRLQGLEPGLNAGTNQLGHTVDSEQRAIYIHGTTMEWKIGRPHTKGCIHMRNKDMIDLFNRVPTGSLVMVAPLSS